MPSIVDNAKQAGFSDDEIGQWATGLRTQAKAAGFNDDEVTAYLGGGIPAPTKVPQPFIDRLMQGTHLSSLWSHLQSGADKADAHSYVAGPGTFLRGAAQGFDTSARHIFSESFENDLRSAGLIADPDTGRAGPVRFINEAFLRPIGNLFDILGRAASAGVSGAAETIGETVNRLGGPSEKAKAEVQNFANYATAEGMSGGHIAGIGHDITGRPIDLPLGGVPKSEDFTAAAKSIVPDADTPFMQKLRSLYEDKGLHPAEVAHDAQSDVTVTQALASRGADLPERYQGSTQLETPAKAAERTEPLPAPVVSPEPPPAVDTPQPAPALPSTIPNNIRSFAPSDLAVDADRFQFKSGGDEAGVTDRLQGVSTWDPIKAGLGLVWEDENGENFIVDGHQRHALAKRIEQADPEQAPRLNAVVVRQADGVSDVEARIIAASKNMAEGTGTAIDAAKIMRDNPDLVKELPPRSELVRQARSLAELGDEPFRMVVNDVVPPNYASIVGRLAPKDDDLQGALLQLLAKTDPANAVQAEAIVRQGIAAGTRRETQATLFGDEQIVSSLYSDRAKVLDRALRELKRDRLVFSTIVRDQDIIQAVGNQLETSANANRAAADAQAVQILQVLANRRGPLSDALSAAARRAADGDSPGAIRSFVAAIRHQAEAGDLVRAADGLKRGRIDAGAENSANIVDPAGTEPRGNAETAASISASSVIKEAQARAPANDIGRATPPKTEFSEVSTGDIGAELGEIPGWEDFDFETLSEMEARRLRRLPDTEKRTAIEQELAALAKKHLFVQFLPDDMRISRFLGNGQWRPAGDDAAVERLAALQFDAKGNRSLPVADINQISDRAWQASAKESPTKSTTTVTYSNADRGPYSEEYNRIRNQPSGPEGTYTPKEYARLTAIDKWQAARSAGREEPGPPVESLPLGHEAVTEQTAQGEQMVMPGTERSAPQAAASREAEGHGMFASERPQEAPGGLFETAKEDEPGLIFGPETGAISWGPPPPKTPLDLARDSILAKISIGERSPKRSLTFSQAYTNVVDQLYPIDAATPAGTPTAANPYRLARLLSGLGAKIDHFLKRGTLDWNAPGQANGPGLEQVLAPVANDLQNFRAFAVAAHALEMEAEGITSGMDTGAARTVAREGIKKYGPVLEELVNYQNRVAAYLRDSGVISHDTYDAMTQRWQLYIPANRVLGDGDGAFGRGGGLQPSDPIHRILGSARDWVDPIENVIRNTAIYTTMADKNAVMQSLRDTLAAGGKIGPGSVSPIALIPTAADPSLDAALDAWLTAHGVPAPPAGVMNFFRAAGAQPDAKGTMSLYDNGVRHTYKVDPEISEAAKGLNRETANIILRVMAPFTAMLRAGEVLSPEFGLRHPFRDFFLASIFSSGGFSPLDMARGFTGFIAKSDEYWHWAASGGGNASMVSLDRRYLQESLEHITQQTGLLTRTINTVFDSNASWLNRVSAIPGLPFKAAQRYVLRPLQVFTELAENASHLGKFIREERATTAATGAPLTREELLEAGWKSRDTAVDAARIGAKMHSLNMISAFANIIIQDTDRWVRGFRDDPVSASLKVMAYITIPQTLLWLYQHDDPRYEEIPAWQRVLSIPVLTDKWEDVGPAGQYGPPAPGTPYRVQGNRMQVNNGAIFRFPQPFSLGVIFGAGPIAALEAFSQHSTKPIWDWLEGFKSIAVPGILPNVGGPILEQFANRSTFTNRTLIPDRLEKQMPEYQYTQYTTETAKALGRLFGAFPGMREQSITPGAMGGGVARALTSPILIENYIRGWTGGLGVYALEIADAALRKEGILPDPPKPASTLADIPFVKAFTIRYPSASAESIQNFQDRYEANRTYYNTWLDKSQHGDGAAATRIAQIGGPRMFVQLDQFKQVISEQSKLIQDVARDPKSSPSDKRQLIDTMYYRTIEIARAGNRALDKIDSALPRASH